MDNLLAICNVSVRKLVTDHPCLSALFFALGGLTFLKFAIKTLVVFAETFLLPGTSLKKFGARKGAWAVVSGASEGIGREYATQLAAKGFNVLAIGRNETTVAAVTDEIDATYGPQINTKRVIIDVSKDDSEAWNKFEQAVAGLDIGVLINNVGRSHGYPLDFIEVPTEEINEIISINLKATLRITRTIIPGMIERKRGLVFNLGSFAGVIPSPMLATYSASKAFLDTFSTALSEEVKRHGIIVQCVNPYFVVSKMSKIRKPTMMIPTPAAFVRASLSKIGLGAGARFTGRMAASTPYWSHSLLDYLNGCLGIQKLSVTYIHLLHKDIRRRYDLKMARLNKKSA